MTDRDPILDATRRLARERQPDRDLWPGIAARLQPPATARSRQAGAVPTRRVPRAVATLAAAAVIAMVVIIPQYTDPVVRQAEPADVIRLDRAWASARAQLAREVADRCEQLPAVACAPYVTGLATLDRTADGLRTALASLPADADARPLLLERYRATVAEAHDLGARVASL
jgi:hypothetical protein